jgi:hypothetical protein
MMRAQKSALQGIFKVSAIKGRWKCWFQRCEEAKKIDRWGGAKRGTLAPAPPGGADRLRCQARDVAMTLILAPPSPRGLTFCFSCRRLCSRTRALVRDGFSGCEMPRQASGHMAGGANGLCSTAARHSGSGLGHRRQESQRRVLTLASVDIVFFLAHQTRFGVSGKVV